MMLNYLYGHHMRRVLGFIIGLIIFIPAHASVTMLGSRIIYPSTARSVDVQLKNNDEFPYIIQTWFDDGDVDAQPSASTGIPFIATPPVFRIAEKGGQLVRISWAGSKSLPQDRESVYWFNILQVPPSNLDGTAKQNRMLIMLRTRVKLFYRPAALSAPSGQIKNLRTKLVWNAKQGLGVEIDNPQPWYASISNIQLSMGGQTHNISADMVSPFSQRIFWLSSVKKSPKGSGTVLVTLINDQGSRINERFNVSLP